MAVPIFSVRLRDSTNSAGEAWRLRRNCLQCRQARFLQFVCSGIRRDASPSARRQHTPAWRRAGFPEDLGSPPRSNPRRRLMARTRTTGNGVGKFPAGCAELEGPETAGHPVSKKLLDRKIAARLARCCPRQVERRTIPDCCAVTTSSAFRATGQLQTRSALVSAN
jgi:hypothetical protein